MYVTLDLDDTLIHTQEPDYDTAIERFATWTSERDDVDADPETIAERLNEVDYENLDEHGLSMERFPLSFEETLVEFGDDPTPEERDRARELGRNAYRTPEEYGERGFREGAAALLDALGDRDATRHLLTAGDPKVQERKIEGLGLRDRLDGVSIVGMGGKTDALERIDENTDEAVIHVGNSASSDVETAQEAGVAVAYVPEGEWRGGSVDPEEENVFVFDTVSELAERIDEVVAAVEANDESEDIEHTDGRGGSGI